MPFRGRLSPLSLLSSAAQGGSNFTESSVHADEVKACNDWPCRTGKQLSYLIVLCDVSDRDVSLNKVSHSKGRTPFLQFQSEEVSPLPSLVISSIIHNSILAEKELFNKKVTPLNFLQWHKDFFVRLLLGVVAPLSPEVSFSLCRAKRSVSRFHLPHRRLCFMHTCS